VQPDGDVPRDANLVVLHELAASQADRGLLIDTSDGDALVEAHTDAGQAAAPNRISNPNVEPWLIQLHQSSEALRLVDGIGNLLETGSCSLGDKRGISRGDIHRPLDARHKLGVPSVIDGDTIEIHGQRIRLNGIDAPESAQLCLDASGKKYRCGQRASLALADFLEAHRPISCIEVDRDRFRRMVAVCTAGGVDIGEWIVRKGYAVDWPRYSAGFYAKAETDARIAKRGLWAGAFDRPWEWRKQMTVQ